MSALPAKTYFLLTKPGIILGNAITTLGGFALASHGRIDFLLFVLTLLAISLVIASACVFNNYIDREVDQKMTRTKDRALAQGLVSSQGAILFAIFLGLLGFLLLILFTSFLTVLLALFGFIIYVIVYSFLKYHTSHGTLVGSFAGATPPLVGYCAVTNQLDIGAILLFMMMALWQMPHFFAIAIYRLDDYVAASIPVLPLKKGIYETKVQMFFYILAFIALSLSLFLLHGLGYISLMIVSLLGVFWLCMSIQGLCKNNDKQWARKMFLVSLVVIIGLCATISIIPILENNVTFERVKAP